MNEYPDVILAGVIEVFFILFKTTLAGFSNSSSQLKFSKISWDIGKSICRLPFIKRLRPKEELEYILSFFIARNSSELSDWLSLQYLYRNSTVLGINYAYTTDFSTRITDSINRNQIVMIPRNVGNLRSLSFTLTQTIKLHKWWDVTLNASVIRLRNDIAYSKTVNYSLTQWAGRANMVQRFKLSGTLGVEVTAVYNSRHLNAVNEVFRHTSQVDIALQKTFGKHAVIQLSLMTFTKEPAHAACRIWTSFTFAATVIMKPGRCVSTLPGS